MRNKSKLLTVLAVCCALVLAFVACAGCTGSDTATTSTQLSQTASPTQTQPASPSSSETQLTLDILDVAVGDGAAEIIRSANSYNDQPWDGVTAYLVHYKVTCDALDPKKDSYYFYPQKSLRLYVDGEVYSPTNVVMPKDMPDVSSDYLYENSIKSGWAYFIAPASDTAYLTISDSDVKTNKANLNFEDKTKYTLSTGEYAKVGDKAKNLIKKGSSLNKLPEDTKMSAYLINYAVKCNELSSNDYIQKNGDLFNPITDLVLTVDGKKYYPINAVLPSQTPSIDATRMFKGDREEGWVYFIAPIGYKATLEVKSPHSYSEADTVRYS